MMKSIYFIIISKKVFSLIISLIILLNVFSVALINNIECIELSNKYAANTIIKCCNITVVLPIKIVTKFFKINISNEIVEQTPLHTSGTENKNQKNENNKMFFQCAVVEDVSFFNLAGTYKNLTQGALLNLYQNYINNGYNVIFMKMFLLLFVVMFSGNIILARGDTENFVENKINKNIKRIRLV